MKRWGPMLILLALVAGCRSRDNAAGFDQAIEDLKKGVEPSNHPVSQDYREGYREVLEKVDAGTKLQQEHTSDQERVRELRKRIGKK